MSEQVNDSDTHAPVHMDMFICSGILTITLQVHAMMHACASVLSLLTVMTVHWCMHVLVVVLVVG